MHKLDGRGIPEGLVCRDCGQHDTLLPDPSMYHSNATDNDGCDWLCSACVDGPNRVKPILDQTSIV